MWRTTSHLKKKKGQLINCCPPQGTPIHMRYVLICCVWRRREGRAGGQFVAAAKVGSANASLLLPSLVSRLYMRAPIFHLQNWKEVHCRWRELSTSWAALACLPTDEMMWEGGRVVAPLPAWPLDSATGYSERPFTSEDYYHYKCIICFSLFCAGGQAVHFIYFILFYFILFR